MLALIQGLSEEQQQVLTLKFVFNFSNGEVATILDKTEGAVKSSSTGRWPRCRSRCTVIRRRE